MMWADDSCENALGISMEPYLSQFIKGNRLVVHHTKSVDDAVVRAPDIPVQPRSTRGRYKSKEK